MLLFPPLNHFLLGEFFTVVHLTDHMSHLLGVANLDVPLLQPLLSITEISEECYDMDSTMFSLLVELYLLHCLVILAGYHVALISEVSDDLLCGMDLV